MIRVLIAEDQALIRGALAALVGREDDIEVVALVERGDQVTAEAVRTRPDVAMIDIEMPGRDGLAAAADLRSALPECQVLILTVFGRPGYLRRAVDSGAVSFLLKDSPPEQLADAIRRTAAGERVIDPKLAVAAVAAGPNPLTPRERDVLTLSVRGASIEEIAGALNLGHGTVRNCLSIAMQKLHAKNRVEAARIAEEKGWLRP